MFSLLFFHLLLKHLTAISTRVPEAAWPCWSLADMRC